ncbi:hypothetical protein AAG570_010250 [Ranatra chinensis]|uniref:Large ribosomal subunit protein bL32m n=1 Tax=Ranatra chinensis TaxID=642074 RepID=A0ABD0Z850_9HEMI
MAKGSCESPRSRLKDIIGDGLLLAVPKSRRSKEKRLNRKFGWPEYVWKPLVPKTNILPCNTCGHSYEAGHLCPNCYKRVRLETEEMQKAIESELKLDPIDKEVVVLYEDEVKDERSPFWKGKRIVEMKKPRPPWFSKNLLQKSTAETSDATAVKPTDLA